MRIAGIIWLEEIVGKLAQKHAVKLDEVRQALAIRLASVLLRKVTAEERMFIPRPGTLMRAGT